MILLHIMQSALANIRPAPLKLRPNSAVASYYYYYLLLLQCSMQTHHPNQPHQAFTRVKLILFHENRRISCRKSQYDRVDRRNQGLIMVLLVGLHYLHVVRIKMCNAFSSNAGIRSLVRLVNLRRAVMAY